MELNEPSPRRNYSEISGLRVEIQENSSQIVVYDVDAASEHEAYEKALSAANHFLNTLSWQLDVHLNVKRESTSVDLTDSDGRKSVFIILGVASIDAKGMPLKVVITDAYGNMIPQTNDSEKLTRIDANASEAAAFHRQAHLTNNPFERFRNLYLTAENIADRIRTKKGLSKQQLQKTYKATSREEALLQFALDQCFKSNLEPLKQVAAKASTIDDEQPLIPQVAKILYKGYRCQLNHSKYSENKKVPFNRKDEEDVEKAIPLMDLLAKSLLKYEETSL